MNKRSESPAVSGINLEFPGVGRIQRSTDTLSPRRVAAIEADLLYLFDTDRLDTLRKVAAGKEGLLGLSGSVGLNWDELAECTSYHPEVEQFERVYFLLRREVNEIKIGTTRDLAKRVVDLQAAHGGALELVRVVRGGKAVEQEFHARFAAFRLRGEWFRAEPVLAWMETA